MARARNELSDAIGTGLLVLAGTGIQLLLVAALRPEHRAPAVAITSLLAGGGALLIGDKRVSGPLAVTAGLGATMAFDQLLTRRCGQRTLVQSMAPYHYIGLEDADELDLEHRPPLG